MNKAPRKRRKEQTKTAVLNLLAELEWLFDYQNFKRYIEWEEKPCAQHPSAAAEVITSLPYRTITIKIFPCFFEGSERQQRSYLLHEFAHCFTDDLNEKATALLEGKLVTPKAIEDSNEEATSRVTMILEGLLQGRKQYAVKAYKRYLSVPKKVGKTKKRR